MEEGGGEGEAAEQYVHMLHKSCEDGKPFV